MYLFSCLKFDLHVFLVVGGTLDFKKYLGSFLIQFFDNGSCFQWFLKMVLEAFSVETFEDLSRGRLLHFDTTNKLHVFRGTEQDWQWHLFDFFLDMYILFCVGRGHLCSNV